MNWLAPSISGKHLRKILSHSLAGALVAGAYGVVHDQITFTLSPEYFHKLKFNQFWYANCGFSPRVFVAEVGFLATWWAGFMAAWFLGRLLVPRSDASRLCYRMWCGLAIVLAGSLAGGLLGCGIGFHYPGDYTSWQEICDEAGVVDLRAFVHVACIHNAGYAGALLGLLLALWRAWRKGTAAPTARAQRRGWIPGFFL